MIMYLKSSWTKHWSLQLIKDPLVHGHWYAATKKLSWHLYTREMHKAWRHSEALMPCRTSKRLCIKNRKIIETVGVKVSAVHNWQSLFLIDQISWNSVFFYSAWCNISDFHLMWHLVYIIYTPFYPSLSLFTVASPLFCAILIPLLRSSHHKPPEYCISHLTPLVSDTVSSPNLVSSCVHQEAQALLHMLTPPVLHSARTH